MPPERAASALSVFAKTLMRVVRTLAAIVLLLSAIPRITVAAQQSPAPPVYDSSSFLAELTRLKTELQTARKSAEGLRKFQESLPEAWAVDSSGSHYVVSTAPLVSRLTKANRHPENREQEADQARNYLGALAAEVSALSEPAPLNMDSARAKLNAILAGREYARTAQPTWWDKLRDRISELFFAALQRLLAKVGGQKSLGYALLWIGICTAAILVAYWIFRHWFRAARVAEMALQSAELPVRSWHEWIFAAREAAGRSDYRVAVHCAYWAGIARLQSVGALAPDRTKTPREYLGALGKSRVPQVESTAGQKQALATLTSRLEIIWYGYRIATEEDFLDSLSQLETLGCHLP